MASSGDEAARYLAKAEEALRNGRAPVAERLANKALQLATSESVRRGAEHLLTRLKKKDDDERVGSSSEPKQSSRDDSSVEQRCQEILKKKDFYEILGVSRDCSADDVKRAYKKLAFICHPDKARCASAEGAFKLVSAAYQALSDPQKRHEYDTKGDEVFEEEVYMRQQDHFMDPKDLFESIFGMQFGGSTHIHRGRTVYYTMRTGPNVNAIPLPPLNLIPIVLICVLSFLSLFFSGTEKPVFSFRRDAVYNYPYDSFENHVRYYVRPSFHSDYPLQSVQRMELEIKIELQHFSQLCTHDTAGTQEQYEKVSNAFKERRKNSKNCKIYEALKIKYPLTFDSWRKSVMSS